MNEALPPIAALPPLDRAQRFRRDGFVVVEAFRSRAQCDALRAQAAAIVDAFDADAQRSVFTTRDQARTADAWFLGSGDTVRCFLEEEALDGDGRLVVPKADAVNKIGHALHVRDPVFAPLSRGADLGAFAAELGLRRPVVVQSMFIAKPARIGGAVRWHQDASFLCTEPASVTGWWFALDDAARDNGCLLVAPGAHRGPLRERFVRDGDAVRLDVVDPTPWPATDDALALEVPAGTLVVFDGRLPHASAPNRSPRPRAAYTLHTVDADAAWAADNWLRRPVRLPL